MSSKTHIAPDETLQEVVAAIKALASSATPEYDSTAGEYTNSSIKAWLAASNDGLAYGYSEPKTATTALTKLGANAGMDVPTPSTIAVPGTDPYWGIGPFRYYYCNAYVDADGTPHVTAIEGDGDFDRYGGNGHVLLLRPVLYWSCDESDDDAVEVYVSDTALAGLHVEPEGLLPTGDVRPYMLQTPYALGLLDSVYGSYSGVQPVQFMSHNNAVTRLSSASTGYSGFSVGQFWYILVMFRLKYATKNSQSVFAGCTSYDYQPSITVAESDVQRVIIATEDAENLLVGSSVSVGTAATGTDRGTSTTYSVLSATRITKIEEYDDDNSAVYLASDAAFSTTEGGCISTQPWECGSCDDVPGDGSPTDCTSGKEPFKLQGIELGEGMYEVISGAIADYDGSGFRMYLAHDTADDASALSDDYDLLTGYMFTSSTSVAWSYPLYLQDHDGWLFGEVTGGSSSTGLCDGHYHSASTTDSEHEVRAFGHLGVGPSAGLSCLGSNGALSGAGWSLGSRLSCTGRRG